MDLFFSFFKRVVYTNHIKKRKDKEYQLEGFVVKILKNLKAYSELVIRCLSTYVQVNISTWVITLFLLFYWNTQHLS